MRVKVRLWVKFSFRIILRVRFMVTNWLIVRDRTGVRDGDRISLGNNSG